MCRSCDTRLYDHGGPLPGNQKVTLKLHGPTTADVEDMLHRIGVGLGRARDLLTRAGNTLNRTVECDPDEFIHHPDDHAAMHYPDGVLHTFTGPNNDGQLHTWHVTTRHPEGTNHEQL